MRALASFCFLQSQIHGSGILLEPVAHLLLLPALRSEELERPLKRIWSTRNIECRLRQIDAWDGITSEAPAS